MKQTQGTQNARLSIHGALVVVMLLAASSGLSVAADQPGPVVNATHLNQPPNQLNGSGSDVAFPFALADDFVINEAGGSFRLEQIDIWGIYAPNSPPATDDFRIIIHNNDGPSGLPGTVVFDLAAAPVTRVATGGVVGVNAEYKYTFVLASQPVLPNGTYWLEIFNNTTGTGSGKFYWERGTADATHGFVGRAEAGQTPGASWGTNVFLDNAVLFNGTSVPVELSQFSIE